MARVKGSALAARLDWVEKHHGKAGIKQLLDALQPDARERLSRGALRSAWYLMGDFIDLGETIDRLWGRGDLGLIKELGRWAADANLKTIYKIFYKVGSTKWILDRGATLWSVHYDSGQLIPEDRGDKSVALKIIDFDEPHKIHCLSVLGWAERSVELSGGTGVSAQETVCRTTGGDHCELVFTWS